MFAITNVATDPDLPPQQLTSLRRRTAGALTRSRAVRLVDRRDAGLANLITVRD
jgi:hypothetical protein